jgi:hypothetical protein
LKRILPSSLRMIHNTLTSSKIFYFILWFGKLYTNSQLNHFTYFRAFSCMKNFYCSITYFIKVCNIITFFQWHIFCCYSSFYAAHVAQELARYLDGSQTCYLPASTTKVWITTECNEPFSTIFMSHPLFYNINYYTCGWSESNISCFSNKSYKNCELSWWLEWTSFMWVKWSGINEGFPSLFLYIGFLPSVLSCTRKLSHTAYINKVCASVNYSMCLKGNGMNIFSYIFLKSIIFLNSVSTFIFWGHWNEWRLSHLAYRCVVYMLWKGIETCEGFCTLLISPEFLSSGRFFMSSRGAKTCKGFHTFLKLIMFISSVWPFMYSVYEK